MSFNFSIESKYKGKMIKTAVFAFMGPEFIDLGIISIKVMGPATYGELPLLKHHMFPGCTFRCLEAI